MGIHGCTGSRKAAVSILNPEASNLYTGYDRLLDLAARGNEALYAVNNVTYTPGRDSKGISELRY